MSNGQTAAEWEIGTEEAGEQEQIFLTCVQRFVGRQYFPVFAGVILHNSILLPSICYYRHRCTNIQTEITFQMICCFLL